MLKNNPLQQRRNGILLPVTALPSHYGIGDLGPGAYRFVDFLADAGQSLWQILPLSPTSTSLCNSPYSSFSAFAGNPLLISPALLIEEGFVTQEEAQALEALPQDHVDYDQVALYKNMLLQQAFIRKQYEIEERRDFKAFCQKQAHWLDGYALYMALKERFGQQGWHDWPQEARSLLAKGETEPPELAHQVLREKIFQYVFFQQWHDLKEYANDKGVAIVGDVPIYVNYDSADVWSYPQYFKLNDQGGMDVVAGVPPDYFSKTGQLWGNPLYDWDVLRANDYDFWMRRLQHALDMYDVIRIDHFRGLVAYWEVPSHEKTAMKGYWVEAPVRDFLDRVQEEFPLMPIIAEDLGEITDDVREVIKDYRLPGMKILMFAFGDDEANPYLPHNCSPENVMYTGTHDNNTVRGWFDEDMTFDEKKKVEQYVKQSLSRENVVDLFVRLGVHSPCHTVILPLQDVCGLGASARFNKPSTTQGNWQWRATCDLLSASHAAMLYELTAEADRLFPNPAVT